MGKQKENEGVCMIILNKHFQFLLLLSVFLGMICWPKSAFVASPFAGTFVNGEGEKVELRQSGNKVDGHILSEGMRLRVSGSVKKGVFWGGPR